MKKYEDALKDVNECLILDPKEKQALQLQEEI